MPMTPLQTLAVVLTVAGVTVLCRALPFLLFRDGRPVSGAPKGTDAKSMPRRQ